MSFKSGFNFHALLFMVGTSFVHVLYYWSLRRGYRIGDISTVYPVARGCGVAGTSVCAYFFLGEDISIRGWEGIALIIAGVILISFKSGIEMKGAVLKYVGSDSIHARAVYVKNGKENNLPGSIAARYLFVFEARFFAGCG